MLRSGLSALKSGGLNCERGSLETLPGSLAFLRPGVLVCEGWSPRYLLIGFERG